MTKIQFGTLINHYRIPSGKSNTLWAISLGSVSVGDFAPCVVCTIGFCELYFIGMTHFLKS